MAAAEVDSRTRWWFLTKEGFEQFKQDPVAQGYEILCRHPRFPHLLPGGVSEHGEKGRSKRTWQQLEIEVHEGFLFTYRRELHNMGLLEIAWLGPKGITFNCTEGVQSILAAVDYWLVQAGMFKRAKDYWRTRVSPKKIDFSLAEHGHPDMVTLNWSSLIEARKTNPDFGYSDQVLATVRTFLEQDLKYKCYRKKRLRELKKQFRRRLQKTDPAKVAMLCAAWDCKQEQMPYKAAIRQFTEAVGSSLEIGDARNHIRRLKELWERAGFEVRKKRAGDRV